MKGLIVIILTVVVTNGLAQNHFVGFKAGVSFANMMGDLFESSDMRVGISSGLTYEYFFNKHMSGSTGIQYNQLGFEDYFYLRDQNGNVLQTEIFRFNYDYISVPFKLNMTMGTKILGFASLGLMPSFLVSAKIIHPGIGAIPSETIDVSDQSTSFDIAGLIELGGGYKISERCQAFASFSGQLSFNTFTNDEYFADADAKHYGFTLSAGMKYALSK